LATLGGTNDDRKSGGKMMMFLMVVIMTMMLGLQARIEYDNQIFGDHHGWLWRWSRKVFGCGLNQINPFNIDKRLPYKLSSIRIGLVMTLMIPIGMYQ
jgi:hypothetical protein